MLPCVYEGAIAVLSGRGASCRVPTSFAGLLFNVINPAVNTHLPHGILLKGDACLILRNTLCADLVEYYITCDEFGLHVGFSPPSTKCDGVYTLVSEM